MSTSIQTYTGRMIDLAEPEPMTPTELAYSLAGIKRYTGHTSEDYSVAEHTVRVALLLRAWGRPAWLQLWGLLHDSGEAYTGDWSSPLKRLIRSLQPDPLGDWSVLGNYERGWSDALHAVLSIETRCLHVVLEDHGLPLDEPPEVKLADRFLLRTEQRDLMPADPGRGGPEPLPEVIGPPWSKDAAAAAWLDLHAQLYRS